MAQEVTFDPSVSAIDDGLDEKPDVEEIERTALRYGIKYMDRANPAGINLDEGELIAILAEKKNRKTTLALNIVRWWCKDPGRLRGGKILWETLESGQTPVKVKQMLICMEATAYMAEKLWGSPAGAPKLTKGLDHYADMAAIKAMRDPAHSQEGPGNLFFLSPGFAKARDRTPLQHEAILAARKRVSEWPLLITGAKKGQGKTKLLHSPNGTGELMSDVYPFKRWEMFVEKRNVKIILLDHINAFIGNSDYDIQNKAVLHGSSAVAELGVVLIGVQQVSLASLRAGGEMEGRGGTRFAEEAGRAIITEYEDGDDKVMIRSKDAREEPFPDIWMPIEKSSGLFFPDSYLVGRRRR